jgi:hypothetical protein
MFVRQFRVSRLRVSMLAGALFLIAASTAGAAPRESFPVARPALDAVVHAPLADQPCLTARASALRISTLLRGRVAEVPEQVWQATDGVTVRYTTGEAAFDRVAPTDRDGDGRPDVAQAAVRGLTQARELLVSRLQLRAPEQIDVRLLELGDEIDGYVSDGDGRTGRVTLVLEASPRGPVETVRRAAIHQFAHSVASALHPRFPGEWAEAFATWTVLHIDGRPDIRTAELISRRTAALGDGLFTSEMSLAGGNAIWFSFVEQTRGLAAIRVTLEELAAENGPAALDRALRRLDAGGLAEAFREFQLWTLLVGDRADRFHFPFASRLREPGFASTSDGMPALSVQGDPALAVWGATRVRILPDATNGAMRVHFEGEFSAAWQADLILFEPSGEKRRLSLDLTPEGRGDVAVPLERVEEAWLLVRHLGAEDVGPRRYTWAVHRERDYPFVLVAIEARQAGDGAGVVVAWETASEVDLVGFNIVRVRETGGRPVTVNPIRMPALGDETNATSYEYFDATADPDLTYVYHVEGVTRHGLTRTSESAIVRSRD